MIRGAKTSERHAGIRVAVLAILMMARTATLSAQSFNIPASSSSTVTVQAGSTITVCDPGGSNANYPNLCNGSLTLVSEAASVISLSGYYSIDSDNDCLYVYDGLSSRDHLIGIYSGSGTASITANSGAMTLIFFSDNSLTQMGFTLTGSVCDTAAGQVRNVSVSQVGTNSATLTWSDVSGGTSWTVRYGTAPNALNSQKHTSSCSTTLTGLAQNTRYYYRIYSNGATTTYNDQCNVTMRQFRTRCNESATECIDYGNLWSCNCEARYGTYANPNLSIGVTNNNLIENTHIKVITSNTTDPRTNNQLYTIPDGYTYSIRLGNWATGGQAENVTYKYHVDTLVHDLLLLKYAAVLEDPSHSACEQPRFVFQILDSTDQPINPTCYSAEFAASNNLGWNTYTTTGYNNMPTNIRWKDWTTVGIDLTPLHGQDIYLRLSTYDCARQQHFGYAYYVLECADKKIEYASCGTSVENTFTAPEGFSYRWYNAANPAVTLDSTQSLHVTVAGDYLCTLTYGTVPGSTCSFTLTATASQRVPAALFSWQEDGYDSCNVNVRFVNESVISHDTAHQQLTDMPCETVTWLFGDGSTSTADTVLRSFPMGAHSVRLVATIGNGSCADTNEQTIVIHSPCEYSDTIHATICDGQTYQLFDTLVATSGVYDRDSGYLHRHLILTVMQNDLTTIHDTIVENSLPYLFADTVVTSVPNDSLSAFQSVGLTFSTVNAAGCDSTVVLNLHVWLNRYTSIDSMVCRDSLPYTWYDTTVTTLSASSGADSTVTVVYTVNSVYLYYDTTSACSGQSDPYGYTASGDYTQSLSTAAGCDSTIHINVTILQVDHTDLVDTVLQNSLPYSFADTTVSIAGTYPDEAYRQILVTANETNIYGCDSTVVLNLHVWLNRHTYLDSSFCSDSLPYIWNDTIITTEATTHGADSVITLILTVLPAFNVDDTAAICRGDTTAYGFSEEGQYSVPLTTVHGCDSLLALTVVVYPVYDLHYHDTLCDNQFPYLFADTTILNADNSTVTVQLSEQTIHHCDSISTLHLTVNPTHRTYEHAVVCDGVPFTWKDGNTYSYSTYEPSIQYSNIHGCDSTLYLILDLNDNFKASMRISPGTATYDNTLIRLQDISASSSREWHYFNTADTSRVVTFNYPLGEDSVEVLMVARGNTGCIDSVHGTVLVDRAIIWPPNAFTPDESINNRFFIPSNDLLSGEVYIYNRQGILITRFDAIDGSWDGTMNGQPCPQGAYTWVMSYTTLSQPKNIRKAKGTVTLLR